MNPDYVMGFGAEVSMARLEDYMAGKMDHDDIVLFYQDSLERDILPARFHGYAAHLVMMGLIYINGRALQ